MKTYKILHLVSSGGMYGAESVILNLSTAMRRYGFHPVVGALCEKGQKQQEEILDIANKLGLESISFPLGSKFDLSFFSVLKNYLKTNNIKIIHSHGYKPTILSFLPAYLAKIPLITTE